MRTDEHTRITRREVLGRTALAGGACLAGSLSGSAVPVQASTARDVTILQAALYLEQEAIAAYEAAAKTGFLPPDVLKVAGAFLDDHRYHRDGIAGVLTKLGQTPDPPLKDYWFGKLQDATDILHLALRLEQGAVSAYRTLASSVENKAVLAFAAHVLVDEVRHATVLRNALQLRNY